MTTLNSASPTKALGASTQLMNIVDVYNEYNPQTHTKNKRVLTTYAYATRKKRLDQKQHSTFCGVDDNDRSETSYKKIGLRLDDDSMHYHKATYSSSGVLIERIVYGSVAENTALSFETTKWRPSINLSDSDTDSSLC